MVNFTVGQSVYWIVGDRIDESTVTKIGKKWVYIGRFDRRFDKNSRIIDSDYPTGQYFVFPTKQECVDAIEKQKLWKTIRRKIDYAYVAPKWIGVEDIRKISEILNKGE